MGSAAISLSVPPVANSNRARFVPPASNCMSITDSATGCQLQIAHLLAPLSSEEGLPGAQERRKERAPRQQAQQGGREQRPGPAGGRDGSRREGGSRCGGAVEVGEK